MNRPINDKIESTSKKGQPCPYSAAEPILYLEPVRNAYLEAQTNSVRIYTDHARARNTIRGYRSSFAQFEIWCQAARLAPLPAAPETIALYLGAQAGRLKAATLQHHLAAIGKAHKTAPGSGRQ